MPTYQYACTTAACGAKFELVQSFTDPSASECPTCGGPVRKVFSAVGVVFKGSGFYRTDSRKASSSAEAGGSSSSTGSSSGSTSSPAGSSGSSTSSSAAPSSGAPSSTASSTAGSKAAASA